MTASLPGVFNVQLLTDAGAPAAGYRLYTYSPGTTTHKVAYTDAAAATPHTYTSDGAGGLYIALNARGELPAPLFLMAGGYDLTLKTMAGATVWTRRAAGVTDSSDSLAEALVSATSGQGSSLVTWQGRLAGQTTRSVESKLTDSFHVRDYGAAGGATETAAIQAAINAVSGNGGGVLHFDGSKTYTVGTLTPKSNVVLSLNGATLKLADATYGLLFNGTGAGGANFAIVGGTLDPNKSGNAPSSDINQAGGGIWLVGWSGVVLHRVAINNAYRSSIVLNACSDVVIDTVTQSNCGQANSFGHFAYGLEAYLGTTRLAIRNFACSNFYGFGIHFYGCTNFSADNLTFANLAQSGNAIGITFTQAARGRVSNVSVSAADWIGIESNASTDLLIENVTVANISGNVPLVMGDNGLAIYNERVTIRNFKSTGSGGTYGANVNWVKRCRLEFFDLDKPITTSGSVTGDRNNVISDSVIASAVGLTPTFYSKFHLQRVSFSDFYVHDWDGPTGRVSNPQVSGSWNLALGVAGVAYVDFSALSALGPQGFVAGKLRVTSWVNNVQGSYSEVPFMVSNSGATANIGTPVTVNNATARALTIAGDAANKRISLTNGTGVALSVQWTVDLHTAMSQ